ncbi:putative RNA recognition motif domain, nucleotide-binding alpha-beta plait domain superfamily [Helianthus annuus]|nr:putative RNA recognition motif domain, nucleotide-binding alpha-beta plait domain superfamily [Helianthus annuus]KAJ0596654.1 putative RNA recognition motif domain, nucleotide-binding alpha-beta plait domain superfamily [Helianthus annuus]KAJ0757321.1 putative RNA recognition motif domain, nucleotide-binding alpha-beta plait domain superfamily [Helianthus annuus]
MDYNRWPENDWNYDDRRKEPWRVAKYKGKRLINGEKNNRRPQRKETSFYIGNLPADCSSFLLRDVFAGFGAMTDAYVPRKKDKKGNTFGFVRFEDVRDAQYMANSLCTARIDYRRLFVKPAKFAKEFVRKNQYAPTVNQVQAEKQGHEIQGGKANVFNMRPTQANDGNNLDLGPSYAANGGRSYAEVITGIKQAKVPELYVNISVVESETSKRWRNNSLVTEIRNPFDLKRIHMLLDEDGINGFTTRYMGGLRFLLTFVNQTEALNFLEHKKGSWEKWFNILHVWDGRHLPFQRLAKLSIRGVPLQFWGPSLFNQIGGLIGKVILPSSANDEDLDLSVSTIGIITNNVARINSKLTIAWHGHPHEILITEDIDAGFPFAPPTSGDRKNSDNNRVYVQSGSTNQFLDDEGSALNNDCLGNMDNNHRVDENLKSSIPNTADPLTSPNNSISSKKISNEGASPNSKSEGSNMGPYDTLPPPPHARPVDMWAKVSGIGLNRLFVEEECIGDTPPIGPTHVYSTGQPNLADDVNQLSPDPFNLRELLH